MTEQMPTLPDGQSWRVRRMTGFLSIYVEVAMVLRHPGKRNWLGAVRPQDDTVVASTTRYAKDLTPSNLAYWAMILLKETTEQAQQQAAAQGLFGYYPPKKL